MLGLPEIIALIFTLLLPLLTIVGVVMLVMAFMRTKKHDQQISEIKTTLDTSSEN